MQTGFNMHIGIIFLPICILAGTTYTNMHMGILYNDNMHMGIVNNANMHNINYNANYNHNRGAIVIIKATTL